MDLKELLYSMALTEAKMKVISAIAEEVYPVVAFQISDYRKDMGKMRDEILGNKRQVSNFNEVMYGVLSRKNIVSTVVIGSMVMSACGVVVETGKVKPTEQITNPAMTETYTSPTETATEIPTAAAVTELPTTTATELPTTTATETQIPTEAASEFPAEVHILSPEELAEEKLYGSGFELVTEFQGIPLDLTMVTSKANLELYKQTRGCMPNQEMVKYGASAEARMAEMVFLGHYVGYLRSIGLTEANAEANYPFDQYIADLKAGADRSYTVWGPRLDGSDGEYRVNPLAPLEYVVTAEKVDPDGNGRGTSLGGGGSSRGYQQLENGGMRMVEAITNTPPDYFQYCVSFSNGFDGLLKILGIDITVMQGRWQLSIGNRYPTSYAKIDEAKSDFTTWNKSNRLIELVILVP